MNILIIFNSIEEPESRGLQRILTNILEVISSQDNKILLLLGAPITKNLKLRREISEKVQKTVIRYYLKEGRSFIKKQSRFKLIKLALEGFLGKTRNVACDIEVKHPKLKIIKYVDEIILSPFIYQFISKNWSFLYNKNINNIIKKNNIDIVLTAEPQNLSLNRKNKKCGVKLVQTILDFLPYEGLDLNVDNYFYSWSKSLDASINNSDYILTISEDTNKKILNVKTDSKTKVIYSYPQFIDSDTSNIDEDAFLNRYKLKKGKYILYVSAIEFRKNIDGLIEGYAAYADKIKIPLILAGAKGYGFEEIYRVYKRLSKNVRSKILWLGYISDIEKKILLKNALLFAWPSKGEGLGIPIMEAIALNVPIVSSRLPTIVEIANNSIHYINNPYDFMEIGSRLEEVVRSKKLRNQILAKYPEIQRKWTKEKFKKRVYEAFEEIHNL